MNFVWFLLIGLAAGWLASQIMKGGRSGEPLSGPGLCPGGGSNPLTSRSAVGPWWQKC